MTASALPLSSLNPGVEWTQDTLGFLHAGAVRSVYVYFRNTTTQVTVYTDGTLTTTMSQPLTTNSNGGVPGWIAAEQEIDFFDVITSARAPAEPISATDMVVDTGVNPLSPISAAVAPRNRGLRDSVSLMDYTGMDPSGATDCTTLVQDALNTGKDVYRPPGIYQVSQVTFTANGQTFWGPGMVIQKTGTVAHLVTFPQNVSDCRFDGGAINGNNAGSGNFGININGVRNGITNTVILNTGYHGAAISSSHTSSPQTSHCYVHNCRVYNTGRQGVALVGDDAGGSPIHCSVTNCHTSATGAAGVGATGYHLVIANNVIENCGFSVTEDGITAYDQTNTDILIIGNKIYNTNNHGIHVGGNRINVTGNHINGVLNSGILVQAAPNATPTACSNATVSGNLIYNVFENAISVGNYSHVNVTGNTCDTITNSHGIQIGDSGSGSHPTSITCSGNSVSNVTAGQGIRIEAVNKVTVTGNVTASTAQDGIKVTCAASETIDTISVTGNTATAVAGGFNAVFLSATSPGVINNATVGPNSCDVGTTPLLVSGNVTNLTVLPMPSPTTVNATGSVTMPWQMVALAAANSGHMEVVAVGGGGGGAGGGSASTTQLVVGGGGGGAGQFVQQLVPLAGVSGLSATIGAGGAVGSGGAAGGNAGSAGSDGGNTILTGTGLTTITAYGGSGGSASTTSPFTAAAAGGMMGASGTGSRSAPGSGTSPGSGGGSGAQGNTSVGWSGGGGGGGGPATATNGGGGGNPGGVSAGGSSGGSGSSGTAAGVAGVAGTANTGDGGGGGGGGAAGTGAGAAGGLGGSGYMQIKWLP